MSEAPGAAWSMRRVTDHVIASEGHRTPADSSDPAILDGYPDLAWQMP